MEATEMCGGAIFGGRRIHPDEYALKQEASARGQSIGVTAGPAVPTLVGALKQVEMLNARMSDLQARCAQVAMAIGGPYPVADNSEPKGRPAGGGAMEMLNDALADAHRRATHINDALDAMNRALGG